MATGDRTDIIGRLRRLLPPGWFGWEPEAIPVVNSLLTAASTVWAFIYSLYAFAVLQSRIATSTGGWLELAANDFFGSDFPRFEEETDAGYSLRIRQEVLRDRATRPALRSVLYDLTGEEPYIFEPWRPQDCGGWGNTSLVFGRAGRYGSRTAPYEVDVRLPYPKGFGYSNRGGWGSRTGGYGGAGNFSFVSADAIEGSGATIRDILAAIERVRAAGVTVYVDFTLDTGAFTPPTPEEPPDTDPPDPGDGGTLDFGTEEGASLIPFFV